MITQVTLSPEDLDALRYALYRMSELEDFSPDYVATSKRLYDFLLGFDKAVLCGKF